nr:RNA-directed DNA polymerase, eukaryota [Tanacetum cinerariifolium]
MTKMISLLMGNHKKVMSQTKLIIMRVMLIEYRNRASCMKTTLLTKMSIVAKKERLDHTQKTLSTFMVYWKDKQNNVCNSCSDEPKFPPGFTLDNNDQEKNVEENIKDTTERVQSLSNKLNDHCSNRGFSSQRSMNSHSQKSKICGSILDLMDELVTVGQTMGYNMAESISLHTIKDLWGNQMSDHVVGSSVGCSGGILYMWNPNMFVKEQVSTCDYFVALIGTWSPTSSKLLIIFIYAPQELNERRDLWNYLCKFIDRWEGDTVIMGDFNEVCSEHERFGFTFNRQGAIAFNNFISSVCLIDLSLKGYAFPWAHKSASKISELDRYLISEDQVQDLERTVTYEEVNELFGIMAPTNHLGQMGFPLNFTINIGQQLMMTALIPKIQNAKFVKGFRPISLTGSAYKIIAKILANRLCVVLPYLISDVQSVFVANHQILDGPFILNELLSWYYLDETLKAFGFSSKWRNWISSCLNNDMGSVLVNGSPTLEFQFYKGLKQGDRLSLLKSVLTSIPFYHMSIFKVPIGMLNHLESIRQNFLYGVDGSDRKLAWIG